LNICNISVHFFIISPLSFHAENKPDQEDIMSDWKLEDIKPAKGKYTWTNKRVGPGHIAARLDRFLSQISFMLMGLTLTSSILPHSVSDHKPITLDISLDNNLGLIPFRFNPKWIQEAGYPALVTKI
jgi:hypothetical protein